MVAQQHRVLAGSLAGGVLVLAVAMWFVLGSEDDALAAPPLALLVALLVALPVIGVAVHVVLDVIGYRPAPLDPALPADEAVREAMVRYQAGTVLRFAVLRGRRHRRDRGLLRGLLRRLPAGAGGRRDPGAGRGPRLGRGAGRWTWTATALERDGARSGLREAFGVGTSGGVIREASDPPRTGRRTRGDGPCVEDFRGSTIQCYYLPVVTDTE